MQTEEKVLQIDIDLLVPNRYQPRKVFEEENLNELAKSISIYGIINPILVRKKEEKYEIIAGERRYRAAKKAGLKNVPVIIRNIEEQELAEIALIENLQRQNLNAIEEAKSYEEIMKISNQTQASLGKKIGKSQAAIANKIRLLSLPQKIQDALSQKKISERHARSLMTVEDEKRQIELLNKIIEEKLTVKDLDNIINTKKITEEEIQEAINDIMKSLNIDTEEPEESKEKIKNEKLEKPETKKEEKESENMNNDNFFPNFNNTMGANNNVSLNTMNMQSMNQEPMAPVQETVMPTPMMDPPLFGGNNPIPAVPELTVPTQEPVLPEPINNPQPMIDQPLFSGTTNIPTGPELTVPQIEPSMASPINEPIIQAPIAPMMEPTIIQEPVIPTFEVPMPQPEMIPQTPIMAPSFEIPVNDAPILEPMVQSPVVEENYTKTIELLNQNGIPFKSYSNETGHCIIIEL